MFPWLIGAFVAGVVIGAFVAGVVIDNIFSKQKGDTMSQKERLKANKEKHGKEGFIDTVADTILLSLEV